MKRDKREGGWKTLLGFAMMMMMILVKEKRERTRLCTFVSENSGATLDDLLKPQAKLIQRRVCVEKKLVFSTSLN